MSTEIEAKLKVDSLAEIADRLLREGAEFVAEQQQTDNYFDGQGHILRKSDRGLRLRRELTSQDERVILAYKGKREKHKFKKREEIEIEVSDAVAAENIILAVGFEKIVTVEKKRGLWKLNSCEVCLDEVALLGQFVEIEGPDEEKIEEVRKRLGLEKSPHIVDSYSNMMRKKFTIPGKTGC